MKLSFDDLVVFLMTNTLVIVSFAAGKIGFEIPALLMAFLLGNLSLVSVFIIRKAYGLED